MRSLKAFLLGALALGVLAYAFAMALALTATRGEWEHLRVGAGPVVLVVVDRIDGATVTTFGAGIAAIAALGGVVNLAAALAIARRRGPMHDSVD